MVYAHPRICPGERDTQTSLAIILNVVDALGTVTKGLVQGQEDMGITGLVETSQLQHC